MSNQILLEERCCRNKEKAALGGGPVATSWNTRGSHVWPPPAIYGGISEPPPRGRGAATMVPSLASWGRPPTRRLLIWYIEGNIIRFFFFDLFVFYLVIFLLNITFSMKSSFGLLLTVVGLLTRSSFGSLLTFEQVVPIHWDTLNLRGVSYLKAAIHGWKALCP